MPHTSDLSEVYRDYIACLNRQDWTQLARFVDADVIYNDVRIGLTGYRDRLVQDFELIPDLHFSIEVLICQPPHIASRLQFDCTPTGSFMGLSVDGRRVSFAENVFYAFGEGRIQQVWSVIDKAMIEAQLS